MGNPLTNNLPTSLDQFLMDMAQTVGPFDYGDVIKFADKIADVKTDKNIATIRKLYKAAKEAAEYDDDEEFAAIGEDLNDIITGVKDFNQPGTLFADTKTGICPTSFSIESSNKWRNNMVFPSPHVPKMITFFAFLQK